MSKYYIGGVATVAAFQNGKHVFTARTLTDSSINISVSSEEIRGGEGAQLLGKFFHTTVFNLSLTDALFDIRYIAGQIGEAPISGETLTWKTAKLNNINYSGSNVTVTLEPGDVLVDINFQGGDLDSDGYYAWCDKLDQNYPLTLSGNTFTFNALSEAYAAKFDSGDLCITYPVRASGEQVIVNAMYTPGVFSLVMRAKLFEGDACKMSDGKPVGEVVVEVPRFQLDGTIDLAMAMTSPATYALNGSALANGCSCETDTWYAKITQVIFDEDPYAGYDAIYVDPDSYSENGDLVRVYAVSVGKMPKEIALTNVTITQNPATPIVVIATDGDTKGTVQNTVPAGEDTSPVVVTFTVSSTSATLNGKTTTITVYTAA